MTEIRILDSEGTPLGVQPHVKGVKVSWKRNEASGAIWSVPRDENLSEDLTSLRRLVEIRDERLPKVWQGVLLDQADSKTEPQLSALSAEYLYSERVTGINWYLDNPVTAGQLIGMLHQEATKRRPMIGMIALGGLDPNGNTVGVTEFYSGIPLQPISDLFQQIATWSGGDWWVEDWRLRFARYRGRDKSGQVLLSGDVVDYPEHKLSAANMATAIYALGASDGVSNDPKDRIALYLTDCTLLPNGRSVVDNYGLVEQVVDFSDVYDLNQLAQVAKLKLAQMSRPARTIGLNIDNRQGNWSTFWLGDTIRIMLSDVGYSGIDSKVVVDAMEFDLDAGKLGLVLEIVESDGQPSILVEGAN